MQSISYLSFAQRRLYLKTRRNFTNTYYSLYSLQNIFCVKCNNEIQRYGWWLYEESLVIEYVLGQVHYEIFFYLQSSISCWYLLFPSISRLQNMQVWMNLTQNLKLQTRRENETHKYIWKKRNEMINPVCTQVSLAKKARGWLTKQAFWSVAHMW